MVVDAILVAPVLKAGAKEGASGDECGVGSEGGSTTWWFRTVRCHVIISVDHIMVKGGGGLSLTPKRGVLKALHMINRVDIHPKMWRLIQ